MENKIIPTQELLLILILSMVIIQTILILRVMTIVNQNEVEFSFTKDYETGCEYIESSSGVITPRLGTKGTHMGCI